MLSCAHRWGRGQGPPVTTSSSLGTASQSPEARSPLRPRMGPQSSVAISAAPVLCSLLKWEVSTLHMGKE